MNRTGAGHARQAQHEHANHIAGAELAQAQVVRLQNGVRVDQAVARRQNEPSGVVALGVRSRGAEKW